MTGAIAIAGMACLRSGAGLVTLGVPASSQAVVASLDPNYMTLSLPCDSEGRLEARATVKMSQLLQEAKCVAIGPGLGRSHHSDTIVAELFETYSGMLIVDADGLNALSISDIWKQKVNGGSSFNGSPNFAPRILTPHPGEWERLSGTLASDREAQKESAKHLAVQTKCTILLKGHATFMTDGVESFINSTGNPSMAVGGTGDCLTGIIAALVCQGMSGMDAVRLGAHLHGLAGDLAHAELQTPSTLATDLIRFLPQAFEALQKR
jgi:ADP-dependent NAD(P)H-hydrate dehydratase